MIRKPGSAGPAVSMFDDLALARRAFKFASVAYSGIAFDNAIDAADCQLTCGYV